MKALFTSFALLLVTAILPSNAKASDAEASADTLVISTQQIASLKMPLELHAKDFITKVYGIIDPGCCRSECIEASNRILNVVPEEDEFGLWVNDETGYNVTYYGMHPQVEANVQFDGKDQLADYGFFFLFPYEGGQRETANTRQMAFCGSLLQELHDMGLTINSTTNSDALFEVIADYGGRLVNIRLIEEITPSDLSSDQVATTVAPDAEGRFIVVLHVEPEAFTIADSLAAIP